MREKKIVLGGGCFWCLEGAFNRVEGVFSAISGYSAGNTVNPSYEQICSGTTGHAEVVEITYDETQLSLDDILSMFFVLHDPTTLNQQGADVGTQYRSIILFSDQEQKQQSVLKINQLEQGKQYQNPIVTEIKALDIFYPAEAYHQNYFANNPSAGYCRAVIEPKLQKFFKQFASRVQ